MLILWNKLMYYHIKLINTMQCLLKLDITIQFSIRVIPYNTIQYHIIQCNNMQFHTTPYNTVQRNSKQYNFMQCKVKPYSIFSQITCSCNMMLCNTIQHYTILYKYHYTAMSYNTL